MPGDADADVRSFLDAARGGNWDFVEAWLLFCPSHLHHINDNMVGRWPALHYAASWKSQDAARMLLQHGADPGVRNSDGKTAADVALECGDDSLAEFLGAAPTLAEVHAFLDNAKAGVWEFVEAWLRKSPSRELHINDMPGGRWSALHQAAWFRSVDAARMLLRYGAEPGLRNSDGLTPADVARDNGNALLESILRDEENSRKSSMGALGTPQEKFYVAIGNTAKPAKRGHFDRWEWQLFVFTRPSSSVELITAVIMGLNETFKPNVVALVRSQSDGSFLSERIVGWGTFVVQLRLHFRGIKEVVTLHHTLVFDEGGSCSTTEINMDELKGKEQSQPGSAVSAKAMHARSVKPQKESVELGEGAQKDWAQFSSLPLRRSQNRSAAVSADSIHAKSTNLREENVELGEGVQEDWAPIEGVDAGATSVSPKLAEKDTRPDQRSHAHHSLVAEAAAGIAAMKLQLAEETSQRKRTKDIAEIAASVAAKKFGIRKLPELDLVVGNTAEPVLRKKNLWEWRIFIRPLQSRPARSVSIEKVVMELHESFRDQIQPLKRFEHGWQFLSRKMVGWGTFEIVLRVHVRGCDRSVTLSHYLSFDDGGSSAEVTIVPSAKIASDSVRITKRLVARPSVDPVVPPANGNQPDSSRGLKTRTSLEAAITQCTLAIDAVKGGKKVTMDSLKRAQEAQAELNQLLLLRPELPSAAELQDQISKAEASRDILVGQGNFSLAMNVQEQIDTLMPKLQAEEEETSLKKGRAILRRVMNADLKPDAVPLEYLEACTHSFSDSNRLGEGAFSEVFVGKDSVLRRKFAVKRLRVSLHAGADIEEARRTFEREILTLTHFRHPNIARLYAYHMAHNLNGCVCLVFELAANGSLDSFLQREDNKERLHWTSRLSIALDVSKAIEYLHSGTSGQVCYHRDIKAANICLRRDLRALLIDTGVSKMLPEHESNATLTIMETEGGLRGTRGYVCPHFARSMRGYSSANEVFSLGIVFAELLLGVLQNSKGESGEEVDLFDYGQKQLVNCVDRSAGVWPSDIMQAFVHLTVEMIRLRPRERPKIQDIVQEVGTLSSRARRWSQGERNRIKFLYSAPLCWVDENHHLHPIASNPDFALEKDILTQCISESRRDIELSFDVATDERFLAAATSRCGCLHFSGHGAKDYLLIEDGTGGAHFLGATELYDRVHQEPFQFVFVSACYSALMGKALVKAGVPHVVCCDHNEELRDDAALKFAHSFYFALAEGFTIQAAFEKGKQVVSTRFGESEESKFLLLPVGADHERPLFEADFVEWDDDDCREKFMPAPPQLFVGRESDMYSLLQAIISNRLVTVCGETGVGCSSLASAVSHYIEERKSAVLGINEIYFTRVDNEGEKAPVDSLVFALQHQLVAEGKMSDEERESWDCDACLRRICNTLSGTKALVVFDGANAGDAALRKAVRLVLDNTGGTKVVVTAQAPIDHGDEHVFHLKPLDRDSSALLFAGTCPHLKTPHERRALHAKLTNKVSAGSSLHQSACFGRYGGGTPSNIIRAARSMTREEYESL